MGLRINSNIDAFTAHRNLELTNLALSRSMQRLSGGSRISSAADDPADLGISERMKAQVSGIEQAGRNAQDGISMAQAADGSLGEISSILQRVRDLAVQYSNGTNSPADQAAITTEVGQLDAEITREIGASQFNGIPLLGPASPVATLQVGQAGTAFDQVAIPGADASVAIGTAVSNFAAGTVSLGAIDAAIDNISANRSTFGSVQNRLEGTVESLATFQENVMAAASRIADVDIAEEMTNFTRLQMLRQSGTAMLAQANQAPSSVLSLLQGR